MSSLPFRATPQWGTDLRMESVSLVAVRGVWVLLILLSVPLLVSGAFSYWDVSAPPTSELAYYFLALAGVFWPLAIWRNEAWEKRDYRWSLPVSTVAHDLTRVLVGWLFLVGGTALLLAVAVYFDLRAGETSEIFFLSRKSYWIAAVTYPTTLYLLVSAFTLCTKAPRLWLIYSILGPSVFVGVLSILGLPQSLVRLIGEGMEAALRPLAIQITGPVQIAPSPQWGWATGLCLLVGALSILVALWRYEGTAR